MNNNIERVEPDATESIAVAEFVAYVKSKGSILKVVGDHYRWVYENTDGTLVVVLPV